MKWPRTLRPLRRLIDARTLRRGLPVAGLALLERLLTPVTALVLFEASLPAKLAVTMSLGLTFTLRSFLQRAAIGRMEAELGVRVTSAVLGGDVLQVSVLPDEDARAELVQGMYFTSQQLAQEIPVLCADVAAALLLASAVAVLEPGRLVLAAVGLAAVAGAALAWSRNRMQAATSRSWKLQERVIEGLVDAIEGRLEIVAAGRRAGFEAEVRDRARAWGGASTRVAASALLGGRLPLLAIAAAVALAIGAGAIRLGALGVTAADLALFASVTPAFAGVAQGLQAIIRAERWVRVVASVVDGQQHTAPGAGALSPLPAPIVFDAVSFLYGGNGSEALRDVAFSWDGTSVLALSGANGSGKSTCLRLLLALAPPTRGRLLVGGADLADLDVEAWRAEVAFLPQRPYMPQRSDVRSAIRLLAPGADDDRILGALARVGVLPALRRAAADPLDARVDALSVGQRQRVGLARLLCRDARLYLLDEPDANLDRDGIAMVADVVRELGREHMVALAAHAPELLDVAGRVVVLEGGRIVDVAPYERAAVHARS